MAQSEDDSEVEDIRILEVSDPVYAGLTSQYVAGLFETVRFRKFGIYSTNRPFRLCASSEPSLIRLNRS